jgi:enamine deaminase RidA (YjgF/YER057c/UK114 family)
MRVMSIRHINPSGLFQMDGFTQVVTATGGRLAFIAGQGAFDKDFQLVGEGDYYQQTLQAFRNLKIALEAVGATPEHVVSSTMYVVHMTSEVVDTFVRAMSEALDGRPFSPNASSLIGVESLAAEGMLVEVSAVAALPE